MSLLIFLSFSVFLCFCVCVVFLSVFCVSRSLSGSNGAWKGLFIYFFVYYMCVFINLSFFLSLCVFLCLCCLSLYILCFHESFRQQWSMMERSIYLFFLCIYYMCVFINLSFFLSLCVSVSVLSFSLCVCFCVCFH